MIKATTTPFEQPSSLVEQRSRAALWKKRYLWLQQAQLGSLIVAGIGGATTWESGSVRLSAILSMIGITVAIVTRSILVAGQPHRRWRTYRGRVESDRSTIWRYATAAAPYGKDQSDRVNERAFIAELPDTKLALARTRESTNELRNQPLEIRQETYTTHRLEHQLAWYREQLDQQILRKKWWSISLYVLYTLAIVTALGRVLGWYDLDLVGIAATVAGAIIAWSQINQYDDIIQAYQRTSEELQSQLAATHHIDNEADWAVHVDKCETTLFREHLDWNEIRLRSADG